MIDSKFSHFIVTRFNLRMKSWLPNVEDCIPWMNDRIEIFETFALPSIAAQTCKNFKWILLFDPSTQETHADFLSRLKKYDFCIPVFLDLDKISLIDGIRNSITENMEPGTNHIITTRMDNDDAIHEDFIKNIQDDFTPGENYVVNFTDGYGYSDNRLSIANRNKVNPFATFCEMYNDGNFKTVYCTGHPALKKIAPVRHIYGKRMYLVNFHENNVLNQHKITTWIGLLWHFLVRYLCIKFPAMNNKIRYSFAIRIPKSHRTKLKKFHIKLDGIMDV